MPRRATIIEVALEAGASKTSVSRYFAGERDKLSPALCERIAAAALRCASIIAPTRWHGASRRAAHV